MEKKVAIVLGGTVPHAELITKLKRRGYYTVLLDYLENSVAKSVADEHIRESTLDMTAVLRVAVDYHADLVISAAVDQANISSCYAMEQLGKYVPYSYETAKSVTNKGYMKKVMRENGIPTSEFVYVDQTYSPNDIDIPFPVMVKPADSNSSNGVKKAENQDELIRYLNEALEFSRNSRAIVEGFMKGREISAYCYVADGRAKLLMTAERLSVTEGENAVIKCYASIAPARISQRAKEKAEDIATRIAKAFGLDNTPLFFQGMVVGDDVQVIEFAPRVAGGLSFNTILENTGFDILEATIDSYTGKKVNFDSYHEPSQMYVINTVYGENGVYDKLIGMEELLKEGVVEHSFIHKTPGMVLDDSRASSSRIAGFIVRAKELDAAKEKVTYVYQKIDALDMEGKSILRKDLNIAVKLKD